MCGTENRLFRTQIEGTLLNVCHHCAKHGEVKGHVHDKNWIHKMERKREKQKVILLSDKEITQGIVEDYAKIIKRKREELNLKQEEVAKKINEKLSLIHKIETGNFEPNMALARKLEKFYKIKLVEQRTDAPLQKGAAKSDSFTLGDFIRIKE